MNTENTNTQHLKTLITGEKIISELRLRKRKDLFKTVKASSKKLVDEKVKIEEMDGWKVVQENTKSTRMKKPKALDEQLEDEVWSILAQMGFKEMSLGRQFKIAVGKGLQMRQFDVFAKDDESVIIVECTQRDTPGKKPMSYLIEKIEANRRGLHKSIQKTYFNQTKLKIKFVIATRRISWTDFDLEKCKKAQISVITDSELDYYVALVHHLKHAARYQLLGHLFEGKKIEGLERAVMATRGKMGGNTFYTFLIPPYELLKISYVGHRASRNIENVRTYQRMLRATRLKKIAEYINKGGKFPTNIVVNLKTKRKNGLQFDKKENTGDDQLGLLHLPSLIRISLGH